VKRGKATVAKARRAKPPARPVSARNATAPKEHKAPKVISQPRKPPPVVEIPEVPPPLPAPIASFTF
jgi:hypothetical protein